MMYQAQLVLRCMHVGEDSPAKRVRDQKDVSELTQAMRRDTDKLDGCGTVASIREQPEVRVRIPGPVESGKKLEVQLSLY